MRKSRKGFILYEVILYLLLSTVCFSVIYNELFFTKKLSRQDNLTLINWHTSMLKLDQLLDGATVDKCKNDKLILTTGPNYKQPNKKYVLEQYKKMIRIRGIDNGHMPLFNHIKQMQMDYQNHVFTMKIRHNNRKIFEYVKKI